MSLCTAFSASAASQGGKIALFWGDSEYSYEHLFSQSLALAAHLQNALGVKPGQPVGIWLKNCPEFIPSLFGILMAGGAAVPINNFLKPQEVAHILGDAGVDLLLSESAMDESLRQLAEMRPGLAVFRIEEFGQLPAAPGFASAARAESDLAVIIYTSGTTGRPKGAMLSHGNLLHNVESCRQMLNAVSFDRFAVLLPQFHSFMLTVGTLLPLLVGGSIVLIKSLHPPKNIIQEFLAREATILPAIPQFFRALANSPLPPNLPLRLCISGAAPLPRATLEEFNRKFTIPLLEGYGLSEASPVVSMNPIPGPWKAGSIGVPIPNVEVAVRGDEGAFLADGEIGEICVRGGNVMLGYLNKPEETAQVLRDGWLLTGDVGYRDSDGYFFITDRKKDMLLVNGINVYPREIEEIIYQFPGVKETGVVGIPDARKGEQAIAFVAPADGATIDETKLACFLRERLADYKLPRRINLIPALPRNATGKVLKTELRKMASQS